MCFEGDPCFVGLYIYNEFNEMEPRDSETSSNFKFFVVYCSKSDRTAHVILLSNLFYNFTPLVRPIYQRKYEGISGNVVEETWRRRREERSEKSKWRNMREWRQRDKA